MFQNNHRVQNLISEDKKTPKQAETKNSSLEAQYIDFVRSTGHKYQTVSKFSQKVLKPQLFFPYTLKTPGFEFKSIYSVDHSWLVFLVA